MSNIVNLNAGQILNTMTRADHLNAISSGCENVNNRITEALSGSEDAEAIRRATNALDRLQEAMLWARQAVSLVHPV